MEIMKQTDEIRVDTYEEAKELIEKFKSDAKKEGYDVIFADPCMERMIPGFEGTFIPLTHFAVSGKLNV